MPRYKMVNGVKVQFTAEEETARDAKEKAWTDGQLNRDLQALRNTVSIAMEVAKKVEEFEAQYPKVVIYDAIINDVSVFSGSTVLLPGTRAISSMPYERRAIFERPS